ncbi:hypothetical protein Vretifemale_3515 [Volvox reticuliferus]|uniref:Thymidine kinase n=1 Tax=Volvox reticuliferus TaxID=1737510 RepID=A0A8J4C3B5_9CHLO|nr:hypothetical protein Vretifemale_3515 [Volvox reticuliferus]
MRSAAQGCRPARSAATMHRLLGRTHIMGASHLSSLTRLRVSSLQAQVAGLGTEAAIVRDEHVNSNKAHGEIHLIMGPMFAGKTTRLLQRVREAQAAGQRVVVVKSVVDTRYSSNCVVTHTGDRLPCVCLARLGSLREQIGTAEYDKVDVVAVDEAQFIEDLAESALHTAESDGKVVIVAGLSGDFQRQRFGQLLELVPLADRVDKLEGRCSFCDQPSLFTLRIAANTQQELVGGTESYAPVCRRHYRELHGVRNTPGTAATVEQREAMAAEA